MDQQPLANSINTSESPKISDNCPTWAQELIARVLLLEIESGTLKNPTTSEAAEGKSSGWSTSNLDDLTKMANRLDRQTLQNMSEEIESLFAKISRGLLNDGFTAEQIAAMINSRIPTGCRLPYCSAQEVKASLA